MKRMISSLWNVHWLTCLPLRVLFDISERTVIESTRIEVYVEVYVQVYEEVYVEVYVDVDYL